MMFDEHKIKKEFPEITSVILKGETLIINKTSNQVLYGVIKKTASDPSLHPPPPFKTQAKQKPVEGYRIEIRDKENDRGGIAVFTDSYDDLTDSIIEVIRNYHAVIQQ